VSGDLSDFVSTLKMQRQMLCFPLGDSLPVALHIFGFRPGQDVLVSFEHERLEIRPRNTPREIQAKLQAGAAELRRFQARMQALLKELPAVSEDELAESETVESELLGTLECLINDDLGPAIQKLESVASLKVESSSEPKQGSKSRRLRPSGPRRRKRLSNVKRPAS